MVLISALAAVTLSGDWFWFGAMAANVAFPIALVSFVFAAVTLAGRRFFATVIVLSAGVVLGIPAVVAPRAGTGGEADARVLVFNVYAQTDARASTLSFLRDVDADVVLLNECSYEFTRRLLSDDAITEKYPHRELPVHDRQWTRGVLSVWPLERIEERDDRWRELRFEYAYRRAQIVHHPDGPFLATVSQYESPRSPARWREGNERMAMEIGIMREYLFDREMPMVLGVDMNATPAAPRSRRFSRETGLARAKPLLAPAGTWPASSPSFLRVPIDDLFVSEGVRVVSWEVIGAETDSDHAPVLVTIDLPEPEPGTPAD